MCMQIWCANLLCVCLQIEEILSMGKLSKLENFKTDEKVNIAHHKSSSPYKLFLVTSFLMVIKYMQVRTLILFSSIWGVGPATAQRFYEKGHRSLNDLNDETSLTASQRVGLRFANDLNVKITRQEVHLPQKY